MGKLLKSFKNAWHGICACAAGERNFRIHCIAAAWVLMLIYTANGTRWDYIAAVVCIALVMGAEQINSAIERLCDLVTEEMDERVRVIKDMAAGGVLVCAAAALVVAIFLFASKDFWLRLLDGMWERGWCAVVLVALPVAAVVLCLPPKNKTEEKMSEEEYIGEEEEK